MRPKHDGVGGKVLLVSALNGEGIGEAWAAMAEVHKALSSDGQLARLRQEQARRWFWNEVEAAIRESVLGDPETAAEAIVLERSVAKGQALPHAAARALVTRLRPA